MKKSLTALLIFLIPFLTSQAQLKEHNNLLGGTLGFWAHNSSPTFGVNYENEVSHAGIGTFGIGGLLRYTNFPVNDERFSNIFLGAQANYNFNQIGDGKFVPFVGLVLGFYSSSPNGNSLKENGLWLFGQAGMRYFFSPTVAGVFRLGLGNFNYNALELGVDFKF